MVEWARLQSGHDALFDPNELTITFYLGIEQLLHIPSTSGMNDVVDFSVEIADVVEAAHPGIIYSSPSGRQRRALSELCLMRATVEHRNATLPSSETSVRRLATEQVSSDIGHPPQRSDAEGLDHLPASLLLATIYLDTLILCHPELQSSFTRYNYLRSPQHITSKILEFALGDAISVVAEWTKTAYKLSRNTVHLFDAKILDHEVPYVLRNVGTNTVLGSGFVPNRPRLATIHAESVPRTVNSIEEFDAADRAGPLDGFLMTIQEATSAFNRGLNRSATVMSAAGAETLLNTVLHLLQWETELMPEVSAEGWDDRAGIQKRVSTNFSNLLGGSWDLTRPGPVGDWARNVANLRNDVVHAGYVPTTAEVENAIETTYSLVTELIDRITNQQNLNRYTRTAVMLAGNKKLEARGCRTRRVQELEEDSSESDWYLCSSRWIAQQLDCLRAKRDGWGDAVPGETEIVLVVRQADLYIGAFEHCPRLGWARNIGDLTPLVEQFGRERLWEKLSYFNSHAGNAYITLQFREPPALDESVFGDKVAAYRLVPDYRVTAKTQQHPELEFRSANDF